MMNVRGWWLTAWVLWGVLLISAGNHNLWALDLKDSRGRGGMAGVMAVKPDLKSQGLAVAQASGGVSFVPKKGKATHAPPAEILADNVSISTASGKTTFSMRLSAGVTVEIFTLSAPYRVVIDLPQVQFSLPPEAGQAGGGLISAFRYGSFDEVRSRIVMDTSGPVRLEGARMERIEGEYVDFKIVLTATDAASFGQGTGAQRSAKSQADERVGGGQEKSPAAAELDLEALGLRPGALSPESETLPKAGDAGQTPAAKKPVIVIDPGHGGVDPGTVGVNNVREKTVVLAVGKLLSEILSASGRYSVKMTRTRDVFVSLNKRLAMSRDLSANLFISLHADAIAQKSFAESVTGATVYTLSDQASDVQARRLAEKENSVDLAAGMTSGAASRDKGQVRNILVDLLKREIDGFSADFSNVLVGKLKRSVKLSRKPRRSAAFKVLKQAYSPSVLVELGYLSNSADAKNLNSPGWRRKVAKSISDAVDSYFAKRKAEGQ